nr:hypothetical protein CFP56_64618 [Quercus suber]
MLHVFFNARSGAIGILLSPSFSLGILVFHSLREQLLRRRLRASRLAVAHRTTLAACRWLWDFRPGVLRHQICRLLIYRCFRVGGRLFGWIGRVIGDFSHDWELCGLLEVYRA